MKATARIIGLPELERQIDNIIKATGKAAPKSSLRQAEIVRDRIKARAPVGPTGNLKRSPIAKLLAEKSGYPAIAIAGIDRKIAPHAGLVEFGWSRAPAHPYFRPAIDESANMVITNLRDDIKDAIEGET